MLAMKPTTVNAGLRRSPLAARPVPVPIARNVIVKFKEGEKAEQKANEIGSKAEELLNKGKQQLNNLVEKGPPTDVNLRDVSIPKGTPKLDANVEVNPALPAFTRRREVIAGRLAMLGFTAAIFAETYLPGHPNITEQLAGYAQLSNLTNIQGPQVLTIIGLLVLYNGIAALAPGSPTWSKENQQDVSKRPAGPPQGRQEADTRSMLGTTGWGFTKYNEVTVGRIAMLGFAAAILGQLYIGGFTGPGPLGQVAHYLNVTDLQSWYGAAPKVFGLWALFTTVLAFALGRPGTLEGEEEVY